MRNFYREEGFDELLFGHNPNGGRPMHIGTLIPGLQPNQTDVSSCEEETQIRYFLGYCNCGHRIVIGPKRAEVIAEMFHKRGIEPRQPRPVVKFARYLLKAVDKHYKMA